MGAYMVRQVSEWSYADKQHNSNNPSHVAHSDWQALTCEYAIACSEMKERPITTGINTIIYIF